MQSICKLEDIGIFHAAQPCFSEKYLIYKYPEKEDIRSPYSNIFLETMRSVTNKKLW